jgi:hypothetical protein
MNEIGIDTFVLFPRRTFIEGVGTLIDVVGSSIVYNISTSPSAADGRAIAADWHAVGGDLRSAYQEYEKSLEPQPSVE